MKMEGDTEIVQRKFCTYCIKVLHGEALNYLDELERQREREVTFSELLQKDLDALYSCDEYDMADYFTVMGRQVPVRDEWISMALKKLLHTGKTGEHWSDGFYQDKAPTGVHDMNSRRYWKNRLPFLLTNLVCMASLTVCLLVH